MKKILFISMLCFIFSCDMPEKEYKFSVQYFNGQNDTITYVGKGENRFVLKGGDLTLLKGNWSKTIASGIRRFDVVSMAEISEQYKEKK